MNQFNLNQFLKRNWFKLLLVGFILFLILKKDFSFQVDLKSPLKNNEQLEEEQLPVQQPAKQKSTERFTEVGRPPTQKSDLFQLNPLAGSKEVHPLMINFNQIDNGTKAAFIKRFGHVAISERKKFGVPSSLILANSLVISQVGTRDISRSGNSFFAIPCSSDWLGDHGTHNGRCIRYYENAWTSFRDHSLFLTTGELASLKSLGPKNFKAWAQALQKAGFYEGPNFDEFIISIINQFDLDQFDRD